MHRYDVTVNGTAYAVDITDLGPNRFRVQLNGRDYEVTLNAAGEVEQLTPVSSTAAAPTPAPPVVTAAAPPPPSTLPSSPAPAGDLVRAPMPGTVLSISVSAGQHVTRGQPLLVLEAMKMNNAIGAPHDGVVADVLVTAGRTVSYGEPLVRLE